MLSFAKHLLNCTACSQTPEVVHLLGPDQWVMAPHLLSCLDFGDLLQCISEMYSSKQTSNIFPNALN